MWKPGGGTSAQSLKGPLDHITDECDALLRAFGDDLPDPENRP